MVVETVEITKLSEFISYIEELPKGFILSRGQNCKYSLLPSGLRKDSRSLRLYSKRTINDFLVDFKIKSHNYMEQPWDINHNLEWMMHAQHFGVPTKLLDFTYSHIFSLMFAVEDAFISKSEDASVWFLDPLKLNHESCRRSEILNISGNEIDPDMYDGPFVIQIRRSNNRINSQKGLFVYFPEESIPLETLANSDRFLQKVVIKKKYKKDIISSLYSIGINKTQIFPELQSVGQDIIIEDLINNYAEGSEE